MGVCGMRNSPLVRTAFFRHSNGVRALPLRAFSARKNLSSLDSTAESILRVRQFFFVRPRKVSTSGLPHRWDCQLAGSPVYEPTCYPASKSGEAEWIRRGPERPLAD